MWPVAALAQQPERMRRIGVSWREGGRYRLASGPGGGLYGVRRFGFAKSVLRGRKKKPRRSGAFIVHMHVAAFPVFPQR
jgi:hypothetical protein